MNLLIFKEMLFHFSQCSRGVAILATTFFTIIFFFDKYYFVLFPNFLIISILISFELIMWYSVFEPSIGNGTKIESNPTL